jgi:hypothetical protein
MAAEHPLLQTRTGIVSDAEFAQSANGAGDLSPLERLLRSENEVGHGSHCSPRHRTPCNSRNHGLSVHDEALHICRAMF